MRRDAQAQSTFLLGDDLLLSNFPMRQFGWRNISLLVFGYIFLDWVSYIHALHGLNITPWSPAPALGLVFLIRFGNRAVWPLALAILLADLWVRQLPVPLATTVGLAAILTFGYWVMAQVLHHRLARLQMAALRQGLFEWAAIVAVGTFIVSLLFVSLLSWSSLIPQSAWPQALVRYWVGDSVGVLITMPLLWMLIDDWGRQHITRMLLSKDALVTLVLVAVAMWVAFGQTNPAHSNFLYALFLPVAWAATRRGLSGAVFSAAVVQIGIIASVQLLGLSAITILEIQILAVVLVLFGFFIGIVVDEKQRVSLDLQHSLHLAAAGEMAGALAHELNQPLSALTTYGAACARLIEKGESPELLRETVSRMVAESYRAADILRRLRDFFRTGSTQLELVQLEALLAAAAAPFQTKLQSLGIELSVSACASRELFVDRLQLEVVFRNLLSNAIDAVSKRPAEKRQIAISAVSVSSDRVKVRIEDSGHGLSPDAARIAFEGYHSSKLKGLGLGLVISRTIVEAHGGSLWAEAAGFGLFFLELPIEGKNEHTL